MNAGLYASFCLSGVLSALFFTTGCATIISDRSYPVSFISEPPGAQIEVKDSDGKTLFSGVTPTTESLDAGNGYFTRGRYTVSSSKEGYTPATQKITASMNGWYWGNFLIGGLIGFLIVDPLTGAMFEIDDQTVTLNLAPAPGAPAPMMSTTSAAAVTEQLIQLKGLRDKGILTEAEYQAKKKAALKDL